MKLTSYNDSVYCYAASTKACLPSYDGRQYSTGFISKAESAVAAQRYYALMLVLIL